MTEITENLCDEAIVVDEDGAFIYSTSELNDELDIESE